MLYLSGMNLSTKLALVPVTVAIVALKDILHLAIADVWLWGFLWFLISMDALIGVSLAIWKKRFDVKRLGGYVKRVAVMEFFSVSFTFVAILYQGRPFESTVGTVRDVVIWGFIVYMFMRIGAKMGGEGKVFLTQLAKALEKVGMNGNGRNGNGAK